MKSFVFWLKFHWSLFLRVQLTITQHQCWPDSLTHICGTRGRWVKICRWPSPSPPPNRVPHYIHATRDAGTPGLFLPSQFHLMETSICNSSNSNRVNTNTFCRCHDSCTVVTFVQNLVAIWWLETEWELHFYFHQAWKSREKLLSIIGGNVCICVLYHFAILKRHR